MSLIVAYNMAAGSHKELSCFLPRFGVERVRTVLLAAIFLSLSSIRLHERPPLAKRGEKNVGRETWPAHHKWQ